MRDRVCKPVSLSDISKYPWSQFAVPRVKSPLNEFPGEFIFDAKIESEKAKNEILRRLVDRIVEYLKSEAPDPGRTWLGGVR